MDFSAFFTIGRDLGQVLPGAYDYGLVALSYLIACLASFAFLQFVGRIIEVRDSVLRWAWLAAGAVTMGGGIWAMHFVGMLAHVLPIPVSYDPLVTAVSMVPAVLAAGVALHVVAWRVVTTTRLLVGGILMGAGIGAMHYTGMAAMRLEALVRYDPALFALSLVAAVLLAVIALQVRFWVGKSGTRTSAAVKAVAGAPILGFAVAAMHYVAMASTFCFAAPDSVRDVAGLSPGMFAIVISIIAGLILVMATAAVIFDRRVTLEIAMREAAMAREKRASEQLMHTRKLEALGQLTGGIAHDFNNILSIIMVKLEAVDEELPPDSPLRRKAASALEAAQRGADLVARMMAFARRRQHAATETDMAALLDSLSGLLKAAVPRTVTVTVTVPQMLHRCVLDRSGLDTALLNLVVNARDAMPSGGQIEISATNGVLAEGDPILPPGLPAGDWVIIAVRDTGTGMPPEIQAQVFEPFFTTKGDGKGTGLGLAMVHDFVHQAGGFITLDSTPGKGTTFRLFLPAVAREPTGRADPGTTTAVIEAQAA